MKAKKILGMIIVTLIFTGCEEVYTPSCDATETVCYEDCYADDSCVTTCNTECY